MDITFVEQLDQVLEDDTFKRIYQSYAQKGKDNKNMFLTKVLSYLISTRDFKNFDYYLQHFSLSYYDGDYRKCFPYDYLKEKGLSKEESEKIIYENYIKNGFLFHITPEENLFNITNRGLQTLNDRARKDMYEETLRVNATYEKITKRNHGLFSMPTLVNIPGGDIYLNEERFTSIYLTSNLDYALKTYGLSGEISTLFVRDFFWAFGRKDKSSEMSKDEIKFEMIDTMEQHPAKIYDDEIENIIGYFNRIYPDEETLCEDVNQSIIMVPTQKVNTSDKKFDFLYRQTNLRYAPEIIIDISNGEVVNNGSISAENLLAIKTDKQKIMRIKKQLVVTFFIYN